MNPPSYSLEGVTIHMAAVEKAASSIPYDHDAYGQFNLYVNGLVDGLAWHAQKVLEELKSVQRDLEALK